MSGLPLILCTLISASPAVAELRRNDEVERLDILVDGREVLSYQYARQLAIPHFWPVRSPSGRMLTEQTPDPYPHHRSLWIADKIQASGTPAVDFYHCWKNYVKPNQPDSGFRHFMRHQRFDEMTADGDTASVAVTLQWIVQEDRPVLNDRRVFRVKALGDGEYLMDLTWQLTPTEQDVKFVSDSVHYAWPYVRIHPQFSGEQGGTMTNDRGQTGQKETNGQVARWMDYSNKVGETTEGLAVLVYPDDEPHSWLTREYGTFGPRRAKQFSGTGFTLRLGESIGGRVGILVHRGNVQSGHVAERYQQYIEGKL